MFIVGLAGVIDYRPLTHDAGRVRSHFGGEVENSYGKNGVLTVPNLISFARIGLIPVFLWYLIVQENPVVAGIILALIGTTDWIDGFIARKFNQISKLGEALDPIADRLAIVAALFGGTITGILPLWFVSALIVREVFVMLMVARLAAKKRMKIDVRFTGKLATFLLYVAIALLFVTVTFQGNIRLYSILIGVAGLVLYYVSAAQYAVDIKKKLAQ